MDTYKLLTPGPLTTSLNVKRQMLFDRCTWDEEYKATTQKIREQLLEIACAPRERYTVVLMQGSGSFGVEATLHSALGKPGESKLLIISNGAYGERIVTMAKRMGIKHTCAFSEYNRIFDPAEIRDILNRDDEITHIVMVHCETTTGILNPIEKLAEISKEYKKNLIIDSMSSFGGIPINVGAMEIDYLISSSNKCIQGVPGFCFVVAKIDKLIECEGISKSLCLDLYDQWKCMEFDGKWRFTSPTHVVAAFSTALDELIEEGGVSARYDRYRKNNNLLRDEFKKLGFTAYLKDELQSPIITSFFFPNPQFDFEHFYAYVKARGFVLYPGKMAGLDTFRIGNIGEIYEDDIKDLCKIVKEYLEVEIHE